MLLEIVALAGDVRTDFHRVGQPDACDLPQRRVRLLRRGRVHACADAPLLRRAAKSRGLHLRLRRGTTLPHELVDSRYENSSRGLRHNKGRRGNATANPGRNGSEVRRSASNVGPAPVQAVRPGGYTWAAMLECSICRRQFDGRFKVMVPPSNEAFDTIECAQRAAMLRGVDPEALTPVVLPTITIAPFQSPVVSAASTSRKGIVALAAILLAPGQAALAGGVGLAAAGTAASIYLTTRPTVQPAHSVSVTAAAPPRAVPSSEAPATDKQAVQSPSAVAVSRPPDAAARALVVARHAPAAAARNLVSTRARAHSSTVSTSGGTQLISRTVPVTSHAAAPVTNTKPAPATAPARSAKPKAKPKPKAVAKPRPHPTVTLPASPSGGSAGENPPTATATRVLASVETSGSTPNPKPPVTSPGGTPPPDGSPPPGGGGGGGTGGDGGGGSGGGGGGGCDQPGNGWGDHNHEHSGPPGHSDDHDNHGNGNHGDDDHGGHGDHDGHGDGHH